MKRKRRVVLVADRSKFREHIDGAFIVHKWAKEDHPVFEKAYDWEGIGPNGVNVFAREDDYLMYYGTYVTEGVNRNLFSQIFGWRYG